MAQTYLNDNMNMPYPFYGFEALPFSMACIVGMGICVHGDEPFGANAVSACSISISENAVNVAVGRRLIDGTFELIGTLYATTEGLSVYVPASVYSVYGDGTEILKVFEQAFAQYAGEHIVTPVIGGTHHEVEVLPEEPLFDAYYKEAGDIVITNVGTTQHIQIDPASTAILMRAYFTTVTSSTNIVLTSAASTGYMVLGTIPEESIGVYNSLFALDPSCITYMRDAVYGKYNTIRVNGYERALGPVLTLNANGLFHFEIEGTTATFVPDEGADALVLSKTDGETESIVTSINGNAIEGTEDYQEPVLELKGYTTSLGEIISWEWARWSPNINGSTAGDNGTLTLELNGTSNFPNCDAEV